MDQAATNSEKPIGSAKPDAAPGPESGTEPEPGPEPNRDPSGHSRRTFLFKVSLLLNGVVGAVLAIPIVGFLIGPALKRSSNGNAWINLGDLAQFPEGETRLVDFRNPVTTEWDGQTGNIPCWVRRISGNDFQVFAINCAHLGCPVRWFAQAKLFLCPCHGGAYYQDGSRASGPPERGLFEYQHKIENGDLMIFAGKMPTLAAKNCGGPRLTQIQPAAVSSPPESTPASVPAPGDNSWPA
jgi:menaquinol-cytochrome c reductase iron-sulfur subunit